MTTQTLSNVWFRPNELRWNNRTSVAFVDRGYLVLAPGSIEFVGRQCRVSISNVESVALGKQGIDFVNQWVQVEYGQGKKAYFADGTWLGWKGLFGGTKHLHAEVVKVVELNRHGGV